MKRVPEIDEIHMHFDDGKVSSSRMSKVRILAVIPFDSVDEGSWADRAWNEDRERYYWVFAPTTDYIIIAKSVDPSEDGKYCTYYYARTNDGGWFSFGGENWNDGRLDSDDEIYTTNFKEK